MACGVYHNVLWSLLIISCLLKDDQAASVAVSQKSSLDPKPHHRRQASFHSKSPLNFVASQDRSSSGQSTSHVGFSPGYMYGPYAASAGIYGGASSMGSESSSASTWAVDSLAGPALGWPVASHTGSTLGQTMMPQAGVPSSRGHWGPMGYSSGQDAHYQLAQVSHTPGCTLLSVCVLLASLQAPTEYLVPRFLVSQVSSAYA
ncbi:hypothetical protein GN956_G24156 [Arapaima gigas]